MFGQQSQQSGLFGGGASTFSTNTAPASQSTSIFGGGGTSTNLFGGSTAATAPMAGGGLFGNTQQQQKPSMFGSSTQPTQQPTQSLFGSPQQQPAVGSSLFQNTAIQSQQQKPQQGLFSTGFGTQAQSNVKFVPVIATDTMMKSGVTTNINTRHMCITAMKEYQNKSLEELRLEDYLAGRKTGQTNTMFTQQQSLQQQSAGSGIFGGASTFSTNVAPASQPTGIFGGGGTTSNLFGGNTAAVAPMTGGGLFASAQQQQKPSMFGPSTQTAQQQPTQGLFTQQQPAVGSSLFQNTAIQPQQQQPQQSIFSTGFGTQAQQRSTAGSFGGFKTTTTTTQASIFGPKPTAFGPAPAVSTGPGLFAQLQQKSIFGPAQPTTNFFSGQSTAPSMFPAPQQQQPFQAQPASFNTQAGGGIFTSPTNTAVGQTAPVTQVYLGSRAQQEIIDAQLAALPYGDSPLLKLSNRSTPTSEATTTATTPAKASKPKNYERFLAHVTTPSSTLLSPKTMSMLTGRSAKVNTTSTLNTTGLMNTGFTYTSIVEALPPPVSGQSIPLGHSYSLGTGPTMKDRSFLSQNDSGNSGTSTGSKFRTTSTRRAKALDLHVVYKDISNAAQLDNSSVAAAVVESEESPPAEEQLQTTRESNNVTTTNADTGAKSFQQQQTRAGTADENEPVEPAMPSNAVEPVTTDSSLVSVGSSPAAKNDNNDDAKLVQDENVDPQSTAAKAQFQENELKKESTNEDYKMVAHDLFGQQPTKKVKLDDILMESRKLLTSIEMYESDIKAVCVTRCEPMLVEREPTYHFDGLLPQTIAQSRLAKLTRRYGAFRHSCRVGFGRGLTFFASAVAGAHLTAVEIRRVNIVLCFEEFLKKFLIDEGRINELADLKRMNLFNWDFPSVFLKLIDSYIIQMADDKDPRLDEKLHGLCESILLPESPSREVNQRIRFGNWLRRILAAENVNKYSTTDGTSTTPAKDSKFCRIYHYLLNGAIREAVNCARSAHLYNLAMLISMYNVAPGNIIRAQIAEQLNAHRQRMATPRMTNKDVYYERILELLAGSWCPSSSTDSDSTWMNVLGVVVWYFAKPATGLSECVELYNEKFCSSRIEKGN